MTLYEAKESVHNYLRDDYCMDDQQISEFMEMIPHNTFRAIRNRAIIVGDVVEPMISWGNRKVERCVMDEIERQKERVDPS